jgi:hypothetical protein
MRMSTGPRASASRQACSWLSGVPASDSIVFSIDVELKLICASFLRPRIRSDNRLLACFVAGEEWLRQQSRGRNSNIDPAFGLAEVLTGLTVQF